MKGKINGLRGGHRGWKPQVNGVCHQKRDKEPDYESEQKKETGSLQRMEAMKVNCG